MKVYPVAFTGKPQNYKQIDKFVSRSAQPQKEDFQWLKENTGITDIVNFRTMSEFPIYFDEQEVVESLGMKYHNIPSSTRHPKEENISEFLKIIKDVKEKNGKVHIHCKAGADRTGMYSFIYKSLENIGTTAENVQEWIKMGHHITTFPDLIGWTKDFVKKLK